MAAYETKKRLESLTGRRLAAFFSLENAVKVKEKQGNRRDAHARRFEL